MDDKGDDALLSDVKTNLDPAVGVLYPINVTKSDVK